MSRPATHSLTSRPLAFLSDVHGNLAALDAVLAELREAGIDTIYVAGDLLYGGDEPLQVWHRLQEVKARCTRGLSDMALATIDPAQLDPGDEHERRQADRFATTRKQLGDIVVERLKRLPEQLRIPLVDGREVVMVHGAPANNSEEMGHDLSDEELRGHIGDDPADIVICGATHVPFHRELEGVEIINVGSVGAAPEGRVAHYTILTPQLEGPVVEQKWVEY